MKKYVVGKNVKGKQVPIREFYDYEDARGFFEKLVKDQCDIMEGFWVISKSFADTMVSYYIKKEVYSSIKYNTVINKKLRTTFVYPENMFRASLSLIGKDTSTYKGILKIIDNDTYMNWILEDIEKYENKVKNHRMSILISYFKDNKTL